MKVRPVVRYYEQVEGRHDRMVSKEVGPLACRVDFHTVITRQERIM